ncbi:MAG: hypothetical protein AABZ64_04535, partial [Nitrospinota bacterium]
SINEKHQNVKHFVLGLITDENGPATIRDNKTTVNQLCENAPYPSLRKPINVAAPLAWAVATVKKHSNSSNFIFVDRFLAISPPAVHCDFLAGWFVSISFPQKARF